jgi:hypothetical protein
LKQTNFRNKRIYNNSWNVAKRPFLVKREEGRGKREEGRGKREEG